MHLHHRIDTTFLAELNEARQLYATVNHSDTYNYNPSGQGKKPGEGPDKIGEAVADVAHEVNPEDGSLKAKEGGTEYKNGWDIQRALEGDGKAVNAGTIDAFTEGLDISDQGKRAEINRQLKDQYGIANADDQIAAGGVAPADESDGKRAGAEVLTEVTYDDGGTGVGFDVQEGDNITDLARRMLGHDPSAEELQRIIDVNKEAGTIENENQINVGQALIVPDELVGPSEGDVTSLKTQARGLDEFMTENGVPTHVWDPNNSLERHLERAKDPAFVQQALGEMQGGEEQERYKAFVENAYGGIDNVPEELRNSDVWKNQKAETREGYQPKDDRASTDPVLPSAADQPKLHVAPKDGVISAESGDGETVDTGARLKPPADGDAKPVLEYWDASGDRRTINVQPGEPDSNGFYETASGNKVRVARHEDGKFWVEVQPEKGKTKYTEIKPPAEQREAPKPEFGAHGSK